MPIQITLPDDVAIDIIKQITENLTHRAAAPKEIETPESTFKKGVDVALHSILKMKVGETFRVTLLAHSLKIPTGSVSDAVQRLKKTAEIAMICKGTWRRLAPTA